MKRSKSVRVFSVLLGVMFAPNSASAGEPIAMPAGATADLVATFNAGGIALNSGRTAEAIEKFKIVTKALPGFAQAHSGLGSALAKMGKNAEAIDELKKAAALQPNDPIVLVTLGQVSQLAGKNADALQAYRKYLSLYPKGQYATQVTTLQKILQFEVSQLHGSSSEGQDNYFSEGVTADGGKWDQMPIPVHIASGAGVEGFKEQYAKILQDSFDTWAAATDGKLSFKFVDKAEGALILCRWTANLKDLINPVEGGQALVAHTKQGKIVKADILILTQNKQLPFTFTDTYVRHVCLHEVGHALGMSGHSSQAGDIMFSAVNYEAATGIMSDRDKKTIGMLYAAVSKSAAPSVVPPSSP